MFISESVLECDSATWNKFVEGKLVFDTASDWKNSNCPQLISPPIHVEENQIGRFIDINRVLHIREEIGDVGKLNKYFIKYMPI